MKYRSRTDIVAQILESANGGATKTRIMYKAFLSYAQLKEYLQMLTESGLIDYDVEGHTFKTTEKGLKFITLYGNMGSLIVSIDSVAPEKIIHNLGKDKLLAR